MFHHTGPARTELQNRVLAAYLAGVAGYVNSAGLVLVGVVTSHVTGNVSRSALQLSSNEFQAAISALGLVGAFFSGAFIASMMLETSMFRRTPFGYGVALSTEAVLLAAFTSVANAASAAHPRAKDAAALLLCVAMGMQNSMVTRISGAVIRTTHLTGVVTDLGIEAARWFRWWRAQASERWGLPLIAGRRKAAQRPAHGRIELLATIVVTFLAGAVGGTLAAAKWRSYALLVPTFAIASGAAYAFWSGREARSGESVPPS